MCVRGPFYWLPPVSPHFGARRRRWIPLPVEGQVSMPPCPPFLFDQTLSAFFHSHASAHVQLPAFRRAVGHSHDNASLLPLPSSADAPPISALVSASAFPAISAPRHFPPPRPFRRCHQYAFMRAPRPHAPQYIRQLACCHVCFYWRCAFCAISRRVFAFDILRPRCAIQPASRYSSLVFRCIQRDDSRDLL